MGEKLVKLLSKTMINEVVRRQQRPETRKRKAMWSRLLLSCLLLSALVIVIWRRKPSSVRPTYTILTMTYEKRAVLLKDFVAHYAKCPSLKSILVVWNSRTDIEATVDMAHIRATSPVPIRFRVEASPSMNNRYRPDSLLSDTDTLLILDDDLRIDCDSIKRALGAFHQSRRRDIVGWFPRFAMLGSPYSYLGEPRTIQRGEYNMILSGAAFVDHRRFELYWAPELADMRAIVDEEWNCDDLLFNFVIASAGGGSRYLRPRTLKDISHETGVGISHDEDGFLRKAESCLRRFDEHFRGAHEHTRLKATRFHFSEGKDPPPDCDERRSKLFCQY